MTVGSRQLPSPERPPGDRQEIEDPPHPPGLQRQPSLIEPSALFDRRGEAFVVPGDLRIPGARLDSHADRRIAEIHDAVGRVDSPWTVLVRLEAVHAVPHASRLADRPQAMRARAIAWIEHEAVRLGERGRAQEGVVERDHATPFVTEPAVVALHRVPDGSKLLVREDVLALGLGDGRLEPRFHRLDLLPEQLVHVIDEVLEDAHVADRLHRDLALFRPGGGDARHTREPPPPVDPQGALAAEPPVAGSAEGERPVELLSDLDKAVQDRRVLGELEQVRLEGRLPARVGIVSVDLECRLHQYRLPSGFHPVMTTGFEVIAGPSGRTDARVCTVLRASSRARRFCVARPPAARRPPSRIPAPAAPPPDRLARRRPGLPGASYPRERWRRGRPWRRILPSRRARSRPWLRPD